MRQPSWPQKTGEQALATYGYEEALAHFQRALEVKQGQFASGITADRDTAALLFGSARAQFATMSRLEYHEPHRNLRLSFDYYVEAGDVEAALAVAEYPLPRAAHIDVGRNRLLSDALALAPPNSLHASLILSEYGAALYYEANDYEGAQEAFSQALTIATREGDQALEMRILPHATEVDLWTLNWEAGSPKGRRAIELARGLDDLTFQITATFLTARMLAAMGRRQKAQRLTEAVLAPAENLRSLTPLWDALWMNGTLCHLAGNWEDGRRFLERGTESLAANTRSFADLAVLNHQVGDFVQGAPYIDPILELAPTGVT